MLVARPVSQAHHTWRGSVITISPPQHTETQTRIEAQSPSQLQALWLVACIPPPPPPTLTFLSCLHFTVVRFLRASKVYVWFQIYDIVFAETTALLQSSITGNKTRRTIRSLSVFKMGIEIKREFPFKLYLRNVNQPGIWGLINFHFPNQIYTIQAVHFSSWRVVSKLGSSLWSEL